jgi:hypothetical protein
MWTFCWLFPKGGVKTIDGAGRKCTLFVLSDMPEGKYGTKFDKDQTLPAGKSYIKATVK